MILVLLAGGVTVRASLAWKTTDLAMKTKVGQARAEAVYSFRNTGDRPVRIISLDPSCRCVTAAPDKAVCGPGESDEIRVDVALTGFSGRLWRSVAVETDDPHQRYTNLTLTLDIPESVSIKPRFVYWKIGDPADAKSLEISMADPKITALNAVDSENAMFKTRVTAQGNGRYRLSIRPVTTARAADAPIELKVRIAGVSQVYVVYAAVKQP